MDTSTEFERVLGWIDRLNSSVAAAKAGQDTMHAMVESAEYELQLLRRQISAVQPEAMPEAAAAERFGSVKGHAAAFNMKLRHPDNLRPDNLRREWWAV